MEIWKLIPSLPSCEASSLGRIRVLPYEAPMPHGGTRRYAGEPRLGDWHYEDCRYVWVHRRKTYRVARLVCEAFHGPPIGRQVAMHLDEDSRNNKSINLQWGTQKENLNAPGFLKYCRSRVGDKNPYSKHRNKITQRIRPPSFYYTESSQSVFET